VNATRRRLRDRVAADPGIHYSELMRALDLAPGQVQYHLRRLERAGRVERLERYGRTHYFPPDYDERDRAALAVVRRETARDVVVYLLESGPARPTEVADALGVARSTLEYHLDRLVDHDLVEKRRDDRGRVTLAAVAPEETAALLGRITPSLPARLTDRFERLVDSLLDPAER
jgi:predicted transcriptional regulator